jgi:hypothetical protein
MSYTRVKTVNFGTSRSGLSTVQYSLNGGSTWSGTGVTESPSSTGIYRATITFTDGFTGTLTWRDGGSPVRYAAEEVNAAEAEGASVLDAPIGGGTLSEAIAAMAAVMAGKLTQSQDRTTDTFRDFKDDDTTRVTSTSTNTARTVTVH